ncbi:MAG: hypothetical protein U0V02_13955 [Anaerolineales bacterium]
MRKQPQFPEDERIRKNREDLVERVQSHLPIAKWGFSLSYVSLDSNEVIFDSEWCRLSVYLYGGRYLMPSEEELRIRYSRLHAPDTYPYMDWNGEQCHCWHVSHYLLAFFLEGYLPSEVVDKSWGLVPVIGQYWQSGEGTQLRRDEPAEFGFNIEAMIWERYGQRLFELFDLRQPELWEQYCQFLKEFYKHKNWQPRPLSKGETPRPHPWMVC